MRNDNFIAKSLELHLFFGRIMKEHALFLEAGFAPANADYSTKNKRLSPVVLLTGDSPFIGSPK